MAIVEAGEKQLKRHGDPHEYRWRWSTGVFVRGRFVRFDDIMSRRRSVPRRDPQIRSWERFNDVRDVPRSILAARFPGRYNPRDEVDWDELEEINSNCKPVSLGEYLGPLVQKIPFELF